MKTEICFNDILLIPKYSKLMSRTDPDLSTTLGNLKLKIPIISAPMDCITDRHMALCMNKLGGLGILSRKINKKHPEEEISKHIQNIKWLTNNGCTNIGCAIGINHSCIELKIQELIKYGCNNICVDVAHADHKLVHSTIKKISKIIRSKNCNLMVGNVCTLEATKRLIKYGANIIKVGIGPGAVCSTRNVTGFGRPQLSAILECAKQNKASIICDGGLRTSGDCVKALWAGADACMLGYMLAGTSCCPKINDDYVYRGMSSRDVSSRRDIAPEGVSTTIAYQGETEKIIDEYIKGIKSGLAMGGSANITELRKCKHCLISSNCRYENKTISPKEES